MEEPSFMSQWLTSFCHWHFPINNNARLMSSFSSHTALDEYETVDPEHLSFDQAAAFTANDAPTVDGCADTTGALRILYRHEHFVVVDKPSGWLFHACAGWMQKENKATHIFTEILERQIGQKVYPTSRLDNGTSGAVLLPLSSEAASWFQSIWSDDALVHKEYVALANGNPQTDEWMVSRPLSKLVFGPRSKKFQQAKLQKKARKFLELKQIEEKGPSLTPFVPYVVPTKPPPGKRRAQKLRAVAKQQEKAPENVEEAQTEGCKVVTDVQRRCGVLAQRQKVAFNRLEALERAVFGPSFVLKREREVAVARQKAEHARSNAAAGSDAVVDDGLERQPCHTEFKTLARYKYIDAEDANGYEMDCALVLATIHSGRTHQIRRHLSHCGHHVLGDNEHGKVGIHFKPLLHGLLKQARDSLPPWTIRPESTKELHTENNPVLICDVYCSLPTDLVDPLLEMSHPANPLAVLPEEILPKSQGAGF